MEGDVTYTKSGRRVEKLGSGQLSPEESAHADAMIKVADAEIRSTKKDISREELKQAIRGQFYEAYMTGLLFDKDKMTVHYTCGAINSAISIAHQFGIPFTSADIQEIYREAKKNRKQEKKDTKKLLKKAKKK